VRLRNKVALVTGAGAGIGKATALLLAKEGARIGVVDYDLAAAEETARLILEAESNAIAICGNVASVRDCAEMVEKVCEKWGSLNVVCNIAGIVFGGTLEQTEEKDWNSTRGGDRAIGGDYRARSRNRSVEIRRRIRVRAYVAGRRWHDGGDAEDDHRTSPHRGEAGKDHGVLQGGWNERSDRTSSSYTDEAAKRFTKIALRTASRRE